ncbi:hypothetical protein SKAU_G00345900 [Synaphobranchus kaupii]|uniref:Cadherin domain-containing protein n=1 Tax=Synaphobranchus kaupii TaxID=118154 RepID=A0A9Q1EJI6_SYNKA|nr:hypothetical protein SKAU_G00345900 [Synaphobranchus kaupii]
MHFEVILLFMHGWAIGILAETLPCQPRNTSINKDSTHLLNKETDVKLHHGPKEFSNGPNKMSTVAVTHEPRYSDHGHQSKVQQVTGMSSSAPKSLPVLVFPQSSKGLKRRKRDWVIPPINFPENDRGPFPKVMVQIRSSRDKEVSLGYHITGPGADEPPIKIFIIDKGTGKLSVTQPLDREGIAKYKLFAYVTDESGDGGRVEVPKEIIINVIDQNDHNPEFTKDPFLGSVAESSPISTFISWQISESSTV